MSHLSARQEYRQLLDALRLPVSERAVARNAAIAALAESERVPAPFEHMAGTS
jgi:chromosome partitioning protein